MDVGVLTAALGDEPLADALECLSGIGVDAVDLGCGGFVGEDHLAREAYLDDESARADLQDLVAEHDPRVSALSTHSNPLHPDAERARRARRELGEAVRLADQLGVDTVNAFSGLPAGGPAGEVPNWVTAPWPPEHAEALAYQWEEVAIPRWRALDRARGLAPVRPRGAGEGRRPARACGPRDPARGGPLDVMP